MLEEALASLSERPMRTLSAGLATFLGLTAAVATLGLRDTAARQVSARFDALQATEVRVRPSDAVRERGVPRSSDPRIALPAQADTLAERLRGTIAGGIRLAYEDDVELATSSWARRDPARRASAPVFGVSAGLLEAVDGTVRGRWVTELQRSRATRSIVLGAHLARRMGVNQLGRPVLVEGVPFTLVGILESAPRDTPLLAAALLPDATAGQLLPEPSARSRVVVRTDPGAALVVASQLALALRPDDPEALEVDAPPDPRRLRQQIEGDAASVMLAAAGVALLVGLVTIASATSLRVHQQRADFGLQRALGATRRRVLVQTLTETSMLGAITGAGGGLAGVLGTAAIAGANHWLLVVDPLFPLAAPAVGIAIGALAGMRPALVAARVEPSEALRQA